MGGVFGSFVPVPPPLESAGFLSNETSLQHPRDNQHHSLFFGLYDSIGTILSVFFRGPVNISYIHLATRVRDGLPRLNTSDPKITQWITTPTIN